MKNLIVAVLCLAAFITQAQQTAEFDMKFNGYQLVTTADDGRQMLMKRDFEDFFDVLSVQDGAQYIVIMKYQILHVDDLGCAFRTVSVYIHDLLNPMEGIVKEPSNKSWRKPDNSSSIELCRHAKALKKERN